MFPAVLIFAALVISRPAGAQVQQFNSMSTGVDGDLNITAQGVTYLDPQAMKIDAAGDNIFNFKTITVAAGATLKISEVKVHGPVYFLAQGDVVINGVIDLSGNDTQGPTPTASEQNPVFAGSGGYSGGLGGVHNDTNHQALPGNGPGGGAAGDINNSPFATGGSFTANRYLVPLIGGSGGGGTNDNGQFGAQGGAGGGGLLIASSTKILLDASASGHTLIDAHGGSGLSRGCGGAGGSVRLVANSIIVQNLNGNFYAMSVAGGLGSACKSSATPGLLRIETNSFTNTVAALVNGPFVTSLPFSLNLPTVPAPVITVSSIAGIPINANPFSFPDATINSATPVAVVVKGTNLPVGATVIIYLYSDSGANQAIPATLTGTTQSSVGTVQVLFPANATRGFVKATWGTLGTNAGVKK